MSDGPQVPAGWYPDPENPTQPRYWTGTAWAAPGPPPPYPPAYPPGVPVYGVPRQSVNGFAVASMILGIVWIYWIGSILALVFGYIAKRQIESSSGRESGGGMATAGIVLGWIGVGIFIVVIVIAIASGITHHGNCSPSFYNNC